MIIVKVFWNTDTKGERVDNEGLEFEAMPQSWYGPFDSYNVGVEWLNDSLVDDKEVFEMTLDEIDSAEVDVEWLNDPKEYPDGYVRVDH